MLILSIPKTKHEECIDITDQVQDYIDATQINMGNLNLHVPEDCTALTILTMIDPDVPADYLNKLNHLIPKYNGMQFMGRNTQAIKASVAGKCLSLIVCDGQLALGKSQRVYFIEFAGPAKNRHIFLNAVGDQSDIADKGTTLFDFHLIEEETLRQQMAEERRLIEEMHQEYLEKQKEQENE